MNAVYAPSSHVFLLPWRHLPSRPRRRSAVRSDNQLPLRSRSRSALAFSQSRTSSYWKSMRAPIFLVRAVLVFFCAVLEFLFGIRFSRRQGGRLARSAVRCRAAPALPAWRSPVIARCQSIWTLAALATTVHLATSLLTNAANSVGVLPDARPPRFSSISFPAGEVSSLASVA